MDLGEIVSISNDSSFYATSPFVIFSHKSNSLYVIRQKTRGIYGNIEHFKGQKKSASIVYGISKDSGRIFGDVITLHEFKGPSSFSPRTAFSPLNENKVFLAWVDKSSPRKLDVYFSRNSEGSDIFEEPIIVSDEDTGVCSSEGSNDLRNFFGPGRPSETYDVVIPYIAAGNDNNVYVMWVESTTTKKCPKWRCRNHKMKKPQRAFLLAKARLTKLPNT